MQGLTLIGIVAAIIGASAVYLRLVVMPRPPVGRFVGSDILIMAAFLIVMPTAYQNLPKWLVALLFGLVFTTAAAAALGGRAGTLIALALGVFVLVAHYAGWDAARVISGDLLLAIAVVGVTNMWAQTGMTAAQVTALAAVLAPYDLVATGLTSVTADLLRHLADAPFTPMLAVSTGDSPIAAGLGDCLILALWPLVTTKAYGRAAGWAGAAIGLAVVAVVITGVSLGWTHGGVPVMTLLGPCIIAQHFFWRARLGSERRTWEWRNGVQPVHDVNG
ncbi:hypothetical protein AB0F17_46250 [Nonomuraea sp. NPDC026600]|uniref:hypothetical protein n=1 Tax=Nonomuraea sp. NPDC026600 TaxID=3155363 RepID=UPI0033CEA870